ncbi:MAG: prohibitin family protein [Cytophagales bacterium]|nr:prohibitin family protein [Cytophagales bacterium]
MLAAAGLIFVIYFSSQIFITIASGEAGVIYRRFGGGTDTESFFEEGFHVIAPWNKLFVYDVRTQERKETMEVLSRNGLTIALDLSIRFEPRVQELGKLHRQLGLNYAEKVVIPEIRTAARKIIGNYTPEELYSSKRDQIQDEVFAEAKENVEKKFISLDAVLVRNITMPATIKEAIEKKLKQEQESMEYEFRLEKEKKEAERKRIEAQGIKDFQDIVSDGLTDKLLKWKGIEATLELAKSENSKIVVIGQGKEGLPIILGGNN